MSISIEGVTPGQITGQYNGHRFCVDGEALLPGFGGPDYVIYQKTLVVDRDQADKLSDEEVKCFFEALTAEMGTRGMTVETE